MARVWTGDGGKWKQESCPSYSRDEGMENPFFPKSGRSGSAGVLVDRANFWGYLLRTSVNRTHLAGKGQYEATICVRFTSQRAATQNLSLSIVRKRLDVLVGFQRISHCLESFFTTDVADALDNGGRIRGATKKYEEFRFAFQFADVGNMVGARLH